MVRTSPISIIREALHPYPRDLVVVTKVGARRGADASWIPAFSREELTQAVHDNLRNLGVDALDVVNLRAMFDVHHPAEGSLEAPLSVLADLQRKGLVRHIGLSNVTTKQIADARRICEIVCVQNHYNLAHRTDDALIETLAGQGIAYVPFFPLGRIHAAAVVHAFGCRETAGCHTDASRARLAAAALVEYFAHPRNLEHCAPARKSGRSATRAFAANSGRVERDCLMSSINSYPQVGFNTRSSRKGHMWPTAFPLKDLTAAEETKICALVKKAVS